MEGHERRCRRHVTHHSRQNQRRYREHYSHRNQQYDSGESNVQNSSSMLAGEPTSSTSVPPDVPELPGFYYDREKNTYFRLLPGHNNCNPLTWETIHQREMEEKRLKMLEEDAINTADTNCERIFVVKNDETGYKYGIVNLEGCGKGSGLISVSMCDNLYSTFRKGTSVCWASLTGHDSHILLCLTGHADTPGSISLLPTSIFSNSSMGLLHRVFVTDAVTGQKQTFSTSSDVLAQQFARRVPVLYNGCRNGEIFSIDIRQRAKKGQGWKCTKFFHNSTVTSVRLLQDENYLMAADMIGKIKLWDLRTVRCVRQYEGHHNKHAHLPIHINEDVGILLAVGQDQYTRIWSLKDGCLLRTIPSPHSGSNDSIPSIAFSSQLGGSSGVPGLLMAVKQDLYHYIYNTDL